MLETQSWPCNKCSKEFKKDKKKNGKRVNFSAEIDPFGTKLDFSKRSFSVEFFSEQTFRSFSRDQRAPKNQTREFFTGNVPEWLPRAFFWSN